MAACIFVVLGLLALHAAGDFAIKDFLIAYVAGALVGLFGLYSMLIFRMFLTAARDLPGMLARASEPDEPELAPLASADEPTRIPPRNIPPHLEDKIHEH
ncbi:MAG: hypothetical protein HY040_22090 [Planctomycetes bacterium]|nr:hypothetical protein [Planctomycetota bacterium]